MKKYCIILFLVVSCIKLSIAQCDPEPAVTYQTTNANGSWTNAGSWQAPGMPPYTLTGGAYTIPTGQVVKISSAQFDLISSIIVNGTLIITGKLVMAAGTSITINSGGILCCGAGGGACNSSDRLSIGGNPVWSGNDGPVSGPAYSDGSQQLPIELSYFNISIPKNQNRTLIEWGTSSEENFSHFEIQRAGKDLYFNTILEVQGAGYNTNSLKEYSAYDENPLIGIGYYRLKAVDIDGSYEYFKVKSVNHGGGRRLLVSPNPTTGNSFTYSINWDPGLYDRISLLDAIGNEVYSAPVTALQNELQINKTLRPGAYLLRYTGPSFQEVTRVFIKD